MINQKAVGNLELGTDLEVDNPEARTEAGVDKDPEDHIELGVDPGVCTVLKVDILEVCNVLGVVPQNNMILLATYIFQLYQLMAKYSLQPSRNKFSPKVVGT